jgi:hypothetical protein
MTLTAKQKKADRDLIETFYLTLKMVGMVEGPSNTFDLPDPTKPNVRITAKSIVDEKTAAALGGKNQALKLLRHCEMAHLVCHHNEIAFGILRGSFLTVVERWPILRSYYETAKIGGYMQAWYRYRRR